MAGRRANYTVVQFQEHLGASEESLTVPWADYVGDETSTHAFTVPTDDAADAYIELQAYDVEAFGHDILVNETPLTGFDIPPAEGWQYWMDTLTGVDLREGENTIRVRRDRTTTDAFVVGVATVHWTEPAD